MYTHRRFERWILLARSASAMLGPGPGFGPSRRSKPRRSFGSLQPVDHVVAVPAHRLQVLNFVGSAMRPVATMVYLKTPGATTPGTSPVIQPERFERVNPVHLSDQNLKRKLIGKMGALSN